MKATIAPALLALALLGAGHAGAAPQDIRLPAENVKLKPAKLPGYGRFTNRQERLAPQSGQFASWPVSQGAHSCLNARAGSVRAARQDG